MAEAIITRRGGILTSSLPYLYNAGDECFSVTDGWEPAIWPGTTVYDHTKESDHLYASVTSPLSNSGFVTARKIDLTGWNYLKADIIKTQPISSGSSQILIFTMNNMTSATGSIGAGVDNSIGTDLSLTLSIDISAITGAYYIACRSQRGAGTHPAIITKFYNVRLTNE